MCLHVPILQQFLPRPDRRICLTFAIFLSSRDSRSFVQHKIKEEQTSREEFNDEQGAYPKAMADVFCSTSMLQNTPYMARGIYEDESGVDQNHTFCVIGHERGRNFFFSVVECVTPILVLNVRGKEQCKQRQDAFANHYGNKTQMHVMNKKMMSQRYKHILWVGPYMVFECIAASGSKHAYISFGAGSYQNYTGACACVQKESPYGMCICACVCFVDCRSSMCHIIQCTKLYTR